MNKNYRIEAIERINNCQRQEDFSTNNMCGFFWYEEKKERKFKPCFRDICEELMDLFKIKKEELNNFVPDALGESEEGQ